MVPAEFLVRSRMGAREAVHCGALAIWSAEPDDLLGSVGDPDLPVVPRSSIKLLHALPFLAEGAAFAFSASAEIMALAASSHAALPQHLLALEDFAGRLGLQSTDLVCGPDVPLGRGARKVPGEVLTAFHNNNSGKHLGVLATCLHRGEAIMGYAEASHPAQQRLMRVVTDLCGIAAPQSLLIDNCGMVTFPLPLSALARGMAALSRPGSLPEPIGTAAQHLLDAIAEAPEFLAGPGRIVTEVARLTGGRVILKGGSEGIYAALDRRHRLGLALKILDGSGEAASAVIIEVLGALGCLDDAEITPLRQRAAFWAHPFQPGFSSTVTFPVLEQIQRFRRS